MVTHVLNIIDRTATAEKKIACRRFIVSGGIADPLQGYGLVEKMTRQSSVSLQAVFGQARPFLAHATGEYQQLKN